MNKTANPTAGNTSRVNQERVLVLDFGSQYSQLIARRVRELNVYCEIVRHNITAEQVRKHQPKGLILSGGPSSVYAKDAPQCDPELFQMGLPILGICYGMQLACNALGGQVSSAPAREYGRARLHIDNSVGLLSDVTTETDVWMSHGDQVSSVSEDFLPLAHTQTCPVAAVKHKSLPVFGLQFHPEVTHTPEGGKVLSNFLLDVCECSGSWKLGDLAQELIEQTRKTVGNDRVICGLSGGVDSSVTAALLYQAIGDQLSCILVDHGLLRKNEQQDVIDAFTDHFHADLRVVQAQDQFLDALA
ncbi:MAG: glutamine-hydrolyzing GMP synthase, partial [Planctomycetaceae bacterium]|nr:glutamine-hydrolyzing GMP synthase [Planctomycetaceae bacterium]